MAIVNRSFSVNVTPGMMPTFVHVSEYDVGRAYTVSIIDEQGNPFTIPSGTTASIEGTLNGKVGFTQSASISNNQVSFTLTEDMTAYSGKAWCKIKLTLNDEPIQTCAFVLAVDRAGVEASTVIGAPGFQEQINEGIAEYFDNDPPFFELPSGGQSGQALLSDGEGGAVWGEAQSGGTGLSNEAKTALLACFQNVAWINDDGQTYYDALYAALYPPADLVSISAVFNQGSAVIYDTDSLDTLKQYLVVTATMTDSTTRTVTDYTLSGTLTVGTSVITVSYGSKSASFNVTVSRDGSEDDSHAITYEVGAISYSDGTETEATNRVRTDFIPCSSGDKFFLFSQEYQFLGRLYDSNKNFVGSTGNSWGTTATASASGFSGGFVRFVIRKSDDSNITANDTKGLCIASPSNYWTLGAVTFTNLNVYNGRGINSNPGEVAESANRAITGAFNMPTMFLWVPSSTTTSAFTIWGGSTENGEYAYIESNTYNVLFGQPVDNNRFHANTAVKNGSNTPGAALYRFLFANSADSTAPLDKLPNGVLLTDRGYFNLRGVS